MSRFAELIVVYHIALGIDDGDSKSRHIVHSHIFFHNAKARMLHGIERLCHMVVVALQPYIQGFYLKLLFPVLLKHYQCHGKDKEYCHYRSIQFLTYC